MDKRKTDAELNEMRAMAQRFVLGMTKEDARRLEAAGLALRSAMDVLHSVGDGVENSRLTDYAMLLDLTMPCSPEALLAASDVLRTFGVKHLAELKRRTSGRN